MALRANRFLRPLDEPRANRPRRDAAHLWRLASRIVVVERTRLNTLSVAAARLNTPVLSNVWWTLVLQDDLANGTSEKAMTLWLNSTIGLITMIAYREETEGAWVKFKKPVLEALPVLNLRTLEQPVLVELAAAYDQLATQALSPLPEIDVDSVRASIDNALSRALTLPNLSDLRHQLAHEPIIRQSTAQLLPQADGAD